MAIICNGIALTMFPTLHGTLGVGSISRHATTAAATAAASRRNLITVFSTTEGLRLGQEGGTHKKRAGLRQPQHGRNRLPLQTSRHHFPLLGNLQRIRRLFRLRTSRLGFETQRQGCVLEDVVHKREDVVGIDSSIIHNPTTWKSSGHLDGFSDPMVDCHETKLRYRADQLYCSPIVLEECGSTIGFVSVLEGNDQDMVKEAKAQANRLLKEKDKK
ncbi:hypothetical protein ACHAW6_000864 [Cyclotella cf. meneghiniana]